MPLSNIVNNIGVGKVEGTFLNLTTTVAAGSATPFTQARIDAFQKACSLFGSNFVGHGTTTYNLFGGVLAASENNQLTKAFPERLVVQVSGFCDIEGTTGAGGAPAINDINPIMQRDGFVSLETTTFRSGRNSRSRGMITEIFNADRCVVLF